MSNRSLLTATNNAPKHSRSVSALTLRTDSGHMIARQLHTSCDRETHSSWGASTTVERKDMTVVEIGMRFRIGGSHVLRGTVAVERTLPSKFQYRVSSTLALHSVTLFEQTFDDSRGLFFAELGKNEICYDFFLSGDV